MLLSPYLLFSVGSLIFVTGVGKFGENSREFLLMEWGVAIFFEDFCCGFVVRESLGKKFLRRNLGRGKRQPRTKNQDRRGKRRNR